MTNLISNTTTTAEKDATLERLWASFEDITCREDPNSIVGLTTVSDWEQFPAGTDVEIIWHFFDTNHSKGVIYLLYGEIA